MAELSYVTPELGQPDKTEDPKITSALNAIRSWANGKIDSGNIKTEGIETSSIKKEAVTGPKLGLETLALLTGATKRKIAWGGPINTSVGFDGQAGRSSLNGSFAHGMGITPVFALIISAGRVAIQEVPGYTVVPAMAVTSLSSTEIKYSTTMVGTSNNGFPFYWIAIG